MTESGQLLAHYYKRVERLCAAKHIQDRKRHYYVLG